MKKDIFYGVMSMDFLKNFILGFDGSTDLFGRVDQNFLFAPEYLIFFAIVTVIAVVLPIMLRRAKPKTVKIIMISLWAFALAYDIVRWFFWTGSDIADGGDFGVGARLPLHTCSTFWYTAPLALFLKDGKLKRALCSYLCTINLFGGIVGMYLGTAMMNSYSFFSFWGNEHMVYHAIVIIMPLIMLVTSFYKPEGKDYILGFLVFLAIGIPTFIFNTIFKTDYMYTYDGSTLDPFKWLAEMMPHRLLWTLVAVIGYFLLALLFHYAAVGIRTLHEKVKNKK